MQLFKTQSFGTHNKRVVFLLTGWRNHIKTYWIIATVLKISGYHVIAYEYDISALSPYAVETVHNLTAIRNDIMQRIDALKKEGHTDYAVFGTSLGSVIGLMVANNSPDISHVILNTTGADVAETVWTWDHIFTYFKRDLLEQKYTLERLQTEWATINPINNIDHLTDKKILVYISEKDEIIPYYLGKKLAETIKDKKINCRVVINKYLSHGLTGAFNLLTPWRYLRFLAD